MHKSAIVPDYLVSSSSHVPSYLGAAATLHRAKLQYSLLTESERIEGADSINAILNDLQALQIKKRLHNEPLHLEAALEYVEIKTHLTQKTNKTSTALMLLEHLRDDFSMQEDNIAREYQAARLEMPDKDQLVTSYMRFVTAEISRLRALQARISQNSAKAIELENKALSLLERLQKNDNPFSPDLVHRVRKSIDAIKEEL